MESDSEKSVELPPQVLKIKSQWRILQKRRNKQPKHSFGKTSINTYKFYKLKRFARYSLE